MPGKVWDEITYPFLNLNGCTVEVKQWISNFIPNFIMDIITYPCFWLKLNHACKGGPRCWFHPISLAWIFYVTVQSRRQQRYDVCTSRAPVVTCGHGENQHGEVHCEAIPIQWRIYWTPDMELRMQSSQVGIVDSCSMEIDILIHYLSPPIHTSFKIIDSGYWMFSQDKTNTWKLLWHHPSKMSSMITIVDVCMIRYQISLLVRLWCVLKKRFVLEMCAC